MKRSAVRLMCGVGALLLLACGAYALVTGDSIITLSHLTDVFLPKAVTQGEAAMEAALQEGYDGQKANLDQAQKDALSQFTGEESALLYSSHLGPRDWSDGDTVKLTTGSGVLLAAGSASVLHQGAFIDVTEGAEVPSGGVLIPGHRYLVGEDTTAEVTIISGAAQLGVQGSYDTLRSGQSATPFYDVSRTDWYYEPVSYVYGSQLFSGMDDHHFAPSAAMNRAMLMTVLYRMAGAPEGELASANVSFADVPDSAWYAPYVKWGAAQGITAGTGPNTFSPEQQVTRQQVVALLYSFGANYLKLDLSGRADLSGYLDLEQTDSWAREPFSWAVSQGVVGSTTAGALTLSPGKSANRAEVATMLRAFAEKIS